MEIYYHQILSKDVGRIELPGNMLDVESVVLDPLANWVFAKFNVLGRFWGHIIGPLDACIIVIVEDSGDINVGKSVARIRDTAREIAEVNNFLQGCITGAYLGLAGAKGRAFRTFAKPANRASVFEDDATIHAPELEQGEDGDISNWTTKLGIPKHVAIHQKGIWRCQCWRNGIVIWWLNLTHTTPISMAPSTLPQ